MQINKTSIIYTKHTQIHLLSMKQQYKQIVTSVPNEWCISKRENSFKNSITI